MWAVAIPSETLLNELLKELDIAQNYSWITSGTGARIAQSTDHNSYPHFFIAGYEQSQIKNALAWVVKNLYPRTIICSGIGEDLLDTQSTKVHRFVPQLCKRSAGRTELKGATVLYEEIEFDRALQASIKEKLESHHFENFDIFSIDRKNIQESEKSWIASNLNCRTYDDFTGEIILSKRRYGLSVACLKCLHHDKDMATRDLIACWRLILGFYRELRQLRS